MIGLFFRTIGLIFTPWLWKLAIQTKEYDQNSIDIFKDERN